MTNRFLLSRKFDRNLIVIGAGSGGLVTSYLAAATRARVTLIEKKRMGGDCLNTGCVPSKAIIRTARWLSELRRHTDFGVRSAHAEFDFADVMDRVRRKIDTVAPHDSVERYTNLGVECIEGEAKIVAPHEVLVNGLRLSARSIVIATGAKPTIPHIPGITNVPYLTSETVWALRALPKRLVVLGGGPIGCELAQAFARLGSNVTQVLRGSRLLPREDDEVSASAKKSMEQDGVKICSAHIAQELQSGDGAYTLVCSSADGIVRIPFDAILIAVGRSPNVAGYGLEELGVSITANHSIGVDKFLRTSVPSIYACGDVVGPYQFTHMAAHQAWYAAVNALFGDIKQFAVDYSTVPWATFIDPEIVRVGLNEREAAERNIKYEVTRFSLAELDRAIVDDATAGFIKVLTAPGRDKILGVTIVGCHASDWIAEFVLAMRHGLGLNKILGTIHIYPTLAEANKYVAGVWRRAHTPRIALRLLEHFHRWRRGESF